MAVWLVALIQMKRKRAVRKIDGIIVLTGPRRRSERRGRSRRPGRLVAFMRMRRLTDAWLSRWRWDWAYATMK